MCDEPPTSNASTRTYPIVSDVTLRITRDTETGEVEVTVLHDGQELYTESVKSTYLYSSDWWSESNPERIGDAIAEHVPDSDQSALRTGIRGAFFEAGIDRTANEVIPWTGGPQSQSKGQFPIQECVPPQRESERIDIDRRREHIRTERYDEWNEAERLEAWVDDPGIGKTTTAALAAADRNDPHVFYLPTHENAHEFTQDPNKPSGYFHLKGTNQPRENCCMEAKISDTTCDTHGEPAEWPRMCPVFEQPEDHDIRQHYEAIAAEIGPQKAHEELGLRSDFGPSWHDGKCTWQKQFNAISERDRVVTVHNYLPVPSVQQVGAAIIDDIQSLLETDESMGTRELEYAIRTLDAISNGGSLGRQYQKLADFAEAVVSELYETYPNSLHELNPPDIEVPQHVQTRVSDEQDGLAETLAWLKHGYHEKIRMDISEGQWDGTPLGIDILLAACAVAGLPEDSARRAIATPPGIDSCPNCDSVEKFGKEGGNHQCGECGWHERDHTLTDTRTERARATAWIETPSPYTDDSPTLCYREIPRVSDLPSPTRTLILDATPAREIYAYLFGVDPGEVHIAGDTPGELNAHITQIGDGQYHRGTLARKDESGNRLRERFQQIINYRCDEHDQVLIVGHKKNQGYFRIPRNAEWMHFYAGRGLNREDTDAVVVLGAPHANVADLKRSAELLAIGRDDVRIGGTEQSSRRNTDGEIASLPPIYTKLYYDDGTGVGRAVPTKGYTGLVGTLFRDTRESELVQLVHRVRPLTADQTKHITLLTNVPTTLPIDTLTTLTELSDPAIEQTNLTNSGLRFMRYVLGVIRRGGPEGFDSHLVFESVNQGQIVGTVSAYHELSDEDSCEFDVSKDTIRNWLNELAEYGLVEKGEYKQREGRLYIATGAILEKALLLLSNNWISKVDAVRRLSEKMENPDGTLGWLEWAEEAFDLPNPTL